MAILEVELLPLVQMWGRRLTAQGAVLTSQLSGGRLERGRKALAIVQRALCCPEKPQLQIVPISMDLPSLPSGWGRALCQAEQGCASDPPGPILPQGSSPSLWPRLGKQGRAGRLGNVPCACQHAGMGNFIRILSALIFSWTQDFQFMRSFVLRWNPGSQKCFGKLGSGCFQWDTLSPALLWLKSTLL